MVYGVAELLVFTTIRFTLPPNEGWLEQMVLIMLGKHISHKNWSQSDNCLDYL